ncbi:Hydroxyacylglutathione hydrolase protein [Marine Group I thaumarchaeote SCGC RSA3]|uniref:Hydroxyacylglutathione hydrolase protein n=3 Tax=Marine Group I TaxID=905826 RepID=A0A081RPR9_9ARCH|nr:Hydroxyacylglutathione hydrolase protein [Marine Group I thaumarchaeote SCGC AAA799-N04]KFM17177.1 Hydroxyacylglutathione hydrolase protein [Marine Group I thaumarchaeote SCGC AAA799-D11]KFM19035.1 Hydroxyacylglutathione hydrolase protein [Marine Group I thaumarchaeote SCGC RSA3]
MIVHQIQVGNMQNFSYIVEDEDTSESIVIDPSWDLIELEMVIKENSLKIKYIVNTHHHFDHTLGNEVMVESTKAPIIQHENSELKHDIAVKDGDVIEFGNSKLKVFHTPGHSKDSICLIGDGKIFSGDTLFVGNCGRIDLPGGSAKELYHSLFDVLYSLDDNLVLYPGHNYGHKETSTIGQEKITNMVMQKRTEQQFLDMMG